MNKQPINKEEKELVHKIINNKLTDDEYKKLDKYFTLKDINLNKDIALKILGEKAKEFFK